MFGKLIEATVPESTQARTSRYTDFQVLPVSILYIESYLSFSVLMKRVLNIEKAEVIRGKGSMGEIRDIIGEEGFLRENDKGIKREKESVRENEE